MTGAPTRQAQGEEMVCPTCNARQTWSDECRRCKADLTLLRQVWQTAQWQRRQCLHALSADEPHRALQHARRYAELVGQDQAARLLGVCHLLCENWSQAAGD
jgi:ribosomal protein L40E